MVKDLVFDKEILSTPCEKATAEDAEIAADLMDTFNSLDAAACLAANQIGATKQIIVYLDDDGQAKTMFNPRMLRALYPMKAEEECLTLEGDSKVTRFAKANIAYDELVDGKLVARKRDFQGNTAQAIQHMIDHCKGKLI